MASTTYFLGWGVLRSLRRVPLHPLEAIALNRLELFEGTEADLGVARRIAVRAGVDPDALIDTGDVGGAT